MKVDWTKPVQVAGTEAHYVGRTFAVHTPHVVASNPIGGHCDLYSVDDFGRDRNDVQVVANVPEPKKVYSRLWVNVYRDKDVLYPGPGVFFYSSLQEANRASGYARIACIRLPDFTEGEGLE